MKTEAIEELIEHCKHIGGIPAMFLKERIIAAEEELKAIKAAQQPRAADALYETVKMKVRCPKCGTPQEIAVPIAHR